MTQRSQFLTILFVFCRMMTPITASGAGEPVSSGAPPREPITLVILHVNDLHGYGFPREFLGNQFPESVLGEEVGSLFSAATLVDQWRRTLFAADPGLASRFALTADDGILFLDGGDSFSGTLDDFNTRGENITRVLNSAYLDVDAAVVGNHSWDFGQDRWRELAEMAAGHHPLLAANVRLEDGSRPACVEDWTTVTVCGVRIAIIGLIADGALRSSRPEYTEGLVIRDPIVSMEKALDQIHDQPAAEKPDMVIVLSHIAFERGGWSRESGTINYFDLIAAMDDVDPGDDGRAGRNVDLFVDAHSHVDHDVKIDNNTWLVQADHYGVKVGQIVFSIDPETHRPVSPPSLVRINLLSKDIRPFAPMVQEFHTRLTEARATNEAVVIRVEKGMKIPTLSRTDMTHLNNPSGNLLTRAILDTARRHHSGPVHLSLVNQTGVRAGLYASMNGAITAGSIHAISPFANPLQIVSVPASALLHLLSTKGVQHRSKLSWAGLTASVLQNGKEDGAEMKRKTLSLDLVDEKTGARTPLADLGDQKLTIAAPAFIVGRELREIRQPDSVINLEVSDRQALADYLDDLSRTHGKLTQEIMENILGTPATLVIE